MEIIVVVRLGGRIKPGQSECLVVIAQRGHAGTWDR